MYCKQCHYSLKGLGRPECPECGRPFEPSDAGTFDRKPRSRIPRWCQYLGTVLASCSAVISMVLVYESGPDLLLWYYGEANGSRVGWGRRFGLKHSETWFNYGLLIAAGAFVGWWLSRRSSLAAVARCVALCAAVWWIGWYLAIHYGYHLYPV